ncbi:MAG: hypothetical protein EP329_07745 [Deltaproteobacteria bacterium]|nr:MAG: hypothetical protein EP329_07745 [Deltaproteobacteria bacterium]
MEPKEIWSVLRAELGPTLTALGLRRLKSSPPAYTLALEGGDHVTLWFKMRSVGGRFTGALQRSPEPKPGIEWTSAPSFRSARLPDLLDDAGWARLVAIHRRVEEKLGGPTDANVARGSDYWFACADAEDVAAWSRLIADALPRLLPAFR